MIVLRLLSRYSKGIGTAPFLGLVSRSPCLFVETNQLHASFIDHPLIIHRKGENPGFLFQ